MLFPLVAILTFECVENAVSQISYFLNSSLLMFWGVFQTDDNSGCFMIIIVMSALLIVSLLDILTLWNIVIVLGVCFIKELENEM